MWFEANFGRIFASSKSIIFWCSLILLINRISGQVIQNQDQRFRNTYEVEDVENKELYSTQTVEHDEETSLVKHQGLQPRSEIADAMKVRIRRMISKGVIADNVPEEKNESKKEVAGLNDGHDVPIRINERISAYLLYQFNSTNQVTDCKNFGCTFNYLHEDIHREIVLVENITKITSDVDSITTKVQQRTNSDSPEPYSNTPRPDDSEPHYVLTVARLRQIRSELMYWYTDKGGDKDEGDYQNDIDASRPQIHKDFNFQLPFFGSRFNYTRVSLNGYLEFSDPPEYYTYPLVFPVKNWPKQNDPSFIGIFFSKCRIGMIRPTDSDRRKPGVYVRIERDLPERKDMFGVEIRERIKWDVRDGLIGAFAFNPKHAVVVTWKNVSFSGGIDNSLYKTNTFQMVLTTDEVNTYVIFNYLNIQWTSHTEAGGDTVSGEGGVSAYVGFNAGNGTRSYEYKPYSQTPKIRDLTRTGWVNGFPGRHIFKIDKNIMSP